MGVKANLPSKMTQEIRGGARGGRDHFSWDNIRSDKYRQNYLGNSIKASLSTDNFWYTRPSKTIGNSAGNNSSTATLKMEIEELKRREKELATQLENGNKELKDRTAVETLAVSYRNNPRYHREHQRKRYFDLHQNGHNSTTRPY